MISPHTAPATKVGLLCDLRNTTTWEKDFRMGMGIVFTVREIVMDEQSLLYGLCGFVALVDECSDHFALEGLRYLALPECLTELLNTAPIDQSELEEV